MTKGFENVLPRQLPSMWRPRLVSAVGGSNVHYVLNLHSRRHLGFIRIIAPYPSASITPPSQVFAAMTRVLDRSSTMSSLENVICIKWIAVKIQTAVNRFKYIFSLELLELLIVFSLRMRLYTPRTQRAIDRKSSCTRHGKLCLFKSSMYRIIA